MNLGVILSEANDLCSLCVQKNAQILRFAQDDNALLNSEEAEV
jgi:hypothetical protein